MGALFSLRSIGRGYRAGAHIAIILSGLLVGTHAQEVYINNFFYRDFLDLGQNRGVFAAGANNTTIESIKTPGLRVEFPFAIPDFSARSSNGNLTALGRGFAVSAKHVVSFDNCQSPNLCRWGQTYYTPKEPSQQYGADTKFTRMTKFIVEGEMPLVDTTITGLTWSDKQFPFESEMVKTNIQALLDRLDKMKDDQGNVYVLQAGQGTLTLKNDKNGVWSTDVNEGISGWDEMRGGGFGTIWRNPSDSDKLSVKYEKLVGTYTNGFGLRVQYDINNDFANRISTGDSGSGLYVYDSQSKKWLLLGVTSQSSGGINGSAGHFSFVAQSDFDDYRGKYEQKINLQNNTWTWNNSTMDPSVSKKENIQDNKDILLSGGGTITAQTDIKLNNGNKSGGLVFYAKQDRAGANVATSYTINGSGKKFDGAGLDIGDKVKVDWNLGFSSDLHKIGKGELSITTNGSNSSNASQNLRLGDGKVVLNTTSQVFKGIYITSGRATLELVKDKIQALGATNGNGSYKLEQSQNTEMSFTFGNGGGNLDLKGNNLTLNTISSNDAGANIINTDSNNQSAMTIQGYGYTGSNGSQSRGSQAADTIIHASFGQKPSDPSASSNNLRLIYKNSTRPQEQADSNSSPQAQNGTPQDPNLAEGGSGGLGNGKKPGAALVFDGNVDVKALEVDKGNVVLQGHPTTHAYIRTNGNVAGDQAETQKKTLEEIKKAEGEKRPVWLDYTRPSRLDQPDWDMRTFTIGKIDLKDAQLSIGRAAKVQGDIVVDDKSQVRIGGSVRHYIDKKDGENTTYGKDTGGFTYQQEVQNGFLSDDAKKLSDLQIHYKGTITANGKNNGTPTIESTIYDFNANLKLTGGATLKATYLTLENHTTPPNTGNTSPKVAELQGGGTKAEVDHILFKNIDKADHISVNSGASFVIKDSITLDKATIDLRNGFNFASIGNMLLDNQSNLTHNSGQGSYNLIVQGASSYTNTGNDFLLTPGKKIQVSGNSSVNIGSGSNGTIMVSGSAQGTAGGTADSTESKPSCTSAQDMGQCLSRKPIDPTNQPEPDSQTIIAVEQGSKLKVDNLKADNKANLYLALSVPKDQSAGQSTNQLASTASASTPATQEQKNFNIDAKNGSSIYINAWDFNRESYSQSSSKQTTMTTDGDSRIHFGTLSYDMNKTNHTTKPIDANLSIYTKLNLTNVGAMPQQGQSQNTDDRFHALQLQINGKNLTLENGMRIDVGLDNSIKADNAQQTAQNGTFELNKYYTLISASTITDNRTDKRIHFTFNNNTPLYWVTRVEKDKIEVKFTKEDPSSYNELKGYINNDKLLQIIIQHNPKNDFVQMAGMAEQYGELNGHIEKIDEDFQELAYHSELDLSNQLLLANDQSINARIAQTQYAQSRFSTTPTYIASNSRKDIILALEAARKANNAYNGAWLSVAGGGFAKSGASTAILGFYGTNIGYDRLFNLGNTHLILGAMAGFGGSNYYAKTLNDIAQVANFGLYGLYQNGSNEIQSNLSFNMIMGTRSIGGELGNENVEANSLGALSHTYYKYNFVLTRSNKLDSVIKPVALLSLGYNSVGAYTGIHYKQQAFDAFNIGLGAGVEYSLISRTSSYTLSLLAKQNLYNSGDKIFVSLSNAQNFVGYDLNPINLTFQLGFSGSTQLGRGFALQYGIAAIADIKGSYGGKADIKCDYRF